MEMRSLPAWSSSGRQRGAGIGAFSLFSIVDRAETRYNTKQRALGPKSVGFDPLWDWPSVPRQSQMDVCWERTIYKMQLIVAVANMHPMLKSSVCSTGGWEGP